MWEEGAPLNEIFSLSPAQLNAEAREIASRSKTNDWLRLAAIIGRIEDEELWPHLGYGSALAYASHELDIDTEQFMVLMNLWKMVKASRPRLSLEEWSTLRITYALELHRLYAASKNADAATLMHLLHLWFERAGAVESADDLRRQIDVHLDKQPFIRWTVSVPTEVAALADQALGRAMEVAGVDPSHARSRRGRHMAFELILRKFVESLDGQTGNLPESMARSIKLVIEGGLTIDADDLPAAAMDLIARHFLSTYEGLRA